MSTEAIQPEPIETPEPAAPPPVLSLKEHAEQFGPKKDQAPTLTSTSNTAVAEPPADPKASTRHRAKSQQASPEDVPRIREMTAKMRAAEERAALAEAEVARLRTPAAPATQAQPAAPSSQEPDPTNTTKYPGGEYDRQYLRDLARFEAKQEYEAQQQAQQRQAAESAKAETQRDVLKNFSERIDAAREKYADFDTVAFGPIQIPEGSLIDAWIMEHQAGPDVLYFLQTHPEELDTLLPLGALAQAERLTLLSQRFVSSASAAAGTTGSAPGRIVSLPPKPPNPVRTEAQRVSTPPPTDGTLSIAEHSRAFARSRR